MHTLYLTGKPTTLSLGPAGLRIVNGKDTTTTTPPYFPYDTIVLQRADGYLSLKALRILMEQKVSIALLDWHGVLKGQFVPYARRGDGGLWLRQLEAAADPKRRLAIARVIAQEGYQRKGVTLDASSARTVAELVRMEARAADAYWLRWATHLAERWLRHDFKSRSRPDYPTNLRAVSRVNAVLNYAYSLLEAAARVACHRVGLHPDVGFLHAPSPHKEPMVYDLQEYGRGWIDEAVLDWLAEPAHQRGYFRTDGWVYFLSADLARSLVAAVSPCIDGPRLLRDARKIAERL